MQNDEDLRRDAVQSQTKGCSDMEERNNIYMPYVQRITSMKETDTVRYSWTLHAGNDREREKDVFKFKQNPSPDHLTATYWG